MNKEMIVSKGSILSAMLLVAGTCVGGGMLALPLATGVGGFVPSIFAMLVCWFAMTATALMLLEVSLWFDEGAHIITMTSKILGPIGKGVSWLLYLYVCYASLVAYTAAGGVQVKAFLGGAFGYDLTKELGSVIFIALFGAVLYLGSYLLGRINTILFTAMIVAYFALIGMGVDEVKGSLLAYRDWSSSLIAVPLLLTAFSFQTMVPSLTPYLKRNASALRWAVIGGTGITFVVYAAWQAVILGIIPIGGANGLVAALAQSVPVTRFLSEHVDGQWIFLIAEYFAFFAIVTSFLGIGLGLFDFLSDGLKIKKEKGGKILLGCLIVLPTLICAIYFERAFIVAMNTTGGFGDSILNGIIPVLMIWIGRYYIRFESVLKVPGGRPFLVLIFCVFLFVLVMEVLGNLGYVSSIYEPYEILEVHNVEVIQAE